MKVSWVRRSSSRTTWDGRFEWSKIHWSSTAGTSGSKRGSRRLSTNPSASFREPPELDAVTAWIRTSVEQWASGSRVTDVRKLEGGQSSLVYRVQVEGAPASDFIIKMAPPGLAPVRNRDVLRQARVIKALGQSEEPKVPTVLFEDAGEPPQVPPLFAMEFLRGSDVEPILTPLDRELPAKDVLRARSVSAIKVLATSIARSPDDIGLAEPRVSLNDEIERWSAACQSADQDVLPRWELCAEALRRRIPAAMPGVVAHGDYRLGNLLAIEGRVIGVIDWELWTISDPRLDVAWMMSFTDQHPQALRPVGDAVLDPSELQTHYEAAIGRGLTDLDWFHAVTRFKAAAITALRVKYWRRRVEPPPETGPLAATGPILLDEAMTVLS